MHGKVWMFSNLIDDEDIEFMQHEFISYKQAMTFDFGFASVLFKMFITFIAFNIKSIGITVETIHV